MPESPDQRARREGLDNADTGSRGGKKRKRRSKPKPTSKVKGKRQSTKERYAKSRDDAEREGLIPTIPDGGVRDERVPPSAQADQPLPELIIEAIRRKWNVPDEKKPALVDEMVATVLDPNAKMKDKIAAFKALYIVDRGQWEQDNPRDAGLAKGANAPVAVSVQSNVLAVKILRETLERDIGRGESDLPAPAEPSTLSHSRFDGEVETGAASTTDQRDAGGSVAYPEQSDINYSTIPAREVPPV